MLMMFDKLTFCNYKCWDIVFHKSYRSNLNDSFYHKSQQDILKNHLNVTKWIPVTFKLGECIGCVFTVHFRFLFGGIFLVSLSGMVHITWVISEATFLVKHIKLISNIQQTLKILSTCYPSLVFFIIVNKHSQRAQF